MARNTAARLGGLAVGVAAGWNISNTGAAATTLHDAYGVSLAAVGLLTTALFATHFAAQVPAGALIDRFGARAVALGALAVISIGNAVALTTPAYWLAVVARLLIGSGTGSGFVAGSDWVRAAGGSTAAQGVYGGVSVGGGGFAIGIVPLLTTGLGWRAPYATALAIALLCAGVVALPVSVERVRRTPARAARAVRALRTGALWPLATLHTASFGLSVIAGNWIVSLLHGDGVARGTAAGVGALTLLGGFATRPLVGIVLQRRQSAARPILGFSIVAGAAGMAVLALPVPLAALAFGAAAVGFASGAPFATVFTGAQRLMPEAPAAAVGVVNSAATFAILSGTPLVGLTFSLPGHGRIGFAAMAAAWACALVALRSVSSLTALEQIG